MAEPLQRQAITGNITAPGDTTRAPTSGVFRPVGARVHDSGNTTRWASAIDKFAALGGKLAEEEKSKQLKTDFVAGQTAVLAGKTFGELQKSGANNTTLQGFATLQAATFNNKWFTDKMEAINSGQESETDPFDYGASLQEQFKGVLTGNEFTDTVTTALAADSIPKLVSAQMVAHSRAKEERTYNAFRDSLATSSIANNSEFINDALYGDGVDSLTGLTPERKRAAIAEAVTLSYSNNSTLLPKLLGVHQYSRDVAESQTKMQSMPDGSARIIASLSDPQVHGGKATPELMMRIAAIESGGNPSAVGPDTTRGRGRAKGMFQFIDSTWAAYGEGDQFNPEESTKAAVRYMNELLDKFDGDETHAVMAYIAGPNAVSKWINGGKKRGFDPHAVDYVQKVLGVDVYEAPGKSLLGQGFTQQQQSAIMKGRLQWYNSEKERWSLNNAARADKIIFDQLNGDISFDEAVSQMANLGMSDDMTKSYHNIAFTRARTEVLEDRQFRTRAPDELVRSMGDYATHHFANGLSMDHGAAEVTRLCMELGMRDSEIERTVSAYQVSYLAQTKIRGEEVLKAEKTFSPEQNTMLAIAHANITEDSSTVYAAIEEMDRILGDRPAAIKKEQEQKILKIHQEVVQKAIEEGKTIPVQDFSSRDTDKLIEWKNQYRAATRDLTGNPSAVRANIEQDIATWGEMHGWNPAKIAKARGMMNKEALDLDSAADRQLLKNQRDAAKAQAKHDNIMEKVNSGKVHELTGNDREAAFDIMTARAVQEAEKELNNDIGAGKWTPEQGIIATAEKQADMLAAQGPGCMSENYKRQFKSIASQPAIDENGAVDSGYLGLVHMYKRLYDQDKGTLAVKYAGDDAAAVMESVMAKDSVGLDPSNAIKQAWADKIQFKDVDTKRYQSYVQTPEFTQTVQNEMHSAIKELIPGYFSKLFMTNYEKPGFSMTPEMEERLKNDPGLIHDVQRKAADLKLRHPNIDDSDVARVAVKSALGVRTPVHGDFIRGSAINQGDALADWGVPENFRRPWTATDIVHNYLDEVIRADSGFDNTAFSLYRSTDAAAASDGSFRLEHQESPSAVMNFRTKYDPGTRRLAVTFYDKDLNESSPVLIDGPLAADMWMRKTMERGVADAGLPTTKGNLRNALRDAGYGLSEIGEFVQHQMTTRPLILRPSDNNTQEEVE